MPTIKNTSYVCNCPDAIKNKSYSVRGGAPPLFLDWSSSNAGAQNGECKHIWAVRILRGEVGEADIPKDVPLKLFQLSEKEATGNMAERERWA